MKRMKKVWALVLALVMVLALGVTNAAAADDVMDFSMVYRSQTEQRSGIPGGEFVMTKTDAPDQGKEYTATSDENGLVTFTGLPTGTYTLKQTVAPLGYEEAKGDKTGSVATETEITVTIKNGKINSTDEPPVEIHDGIYAEFQVQSGTGYQWPEGNSNPAYVIPDFVSAYTMTTIRIPFTKKVTLGGNAAPGSQKFELKITPAVTVNVKTTAEVETTGAGTYNRTITIEGAKSQVVNLVGRGFAVEEVNGGAANWTYDSTKYNVTKTGQAEWDGTGTPTFAYYPVVNGQQSNEAVAEMNFTNTYTRNVSFYYNNTTTTETKGSPKTFDAGIGVYAVSALLSVTGGAWLVGKKHK